MMEAKRPRLLLAGTNSGCGKTTVTCALLQVLQNRGLQPGALKCGPDYIDPMFHQKIIGAKSANLDPFLLEGNTLRYLLARGSEGCGLAVLEGVMGFYDGLALDSWEASTYVVARETETPVVLVVNAAGSALSALAQVQGFADFAPFSGVAGVIFNQCSPMVYPGLARGVKSRFGARIQPLGYLPKLPQCALESRHLGLVTAGEVTDLRQKLATLAQTAEESLDISGLLRLGEKAPPLRYEPVTIQGGPPVRVALAWDRAFSFAYQDNLRALEEGGAELVPFSPLEDACLPEGVSGLILPGGYPELYKEALGSNQAMCQAVKAAIQRGMPCIAECGGFLYLQKTLSGVPMVGALPGESEDAGRLVRFGYATLTAREDSMLLRAGEQVRIHEFHRWDTTCPGDALEARKPSGRSWRCGVVGKRLYAGFPHLHFYAKPDMAERFCDACRQYQEEQHD